jgi:Domain of unknown function (DUF6371)
VSNTAHRFILEPYKGMASRYNCPSCDKKTFTRYIDTEKGGHIADHVGKCSRLDNCDHHYTPKEFFKDNPNLSNKEDWKKAEYKKIPQPPPQPPSFMPVDALKDSINNYESNHFIKYLRGLFGDSLTNKLIEDYFIGTSTHWKGSTVFWQVDTKHKIRAGKIMLYNSDTGKRVKEKRLDRATNEEYTYSFTTWQHKILKIENYNLKQCFFGEHLLSKDRTKTVAIVESEKTAIIASAYLPNFIWLAIGSMSNLQHYRCEALRGRKVVLFPDLGKGFIDWSEKAKKYEFSSIAHFTVSDLLERKASQEERAKGLDLADYLVRFDIKAFQPKISPVIVPIKEAEQKPVMQVTQVTQKENLFFNGNADTHTPEQKPVTQVTQVTQKENLFFNAPLTNQPQAWDDIITDLENFFASINLLSDQFVDVSLETVKANNGKKVYLPSLERLQAYAVKNGFLGA